MFIPEFVCGIVATLGAEMAALIIGSVVIYARKKGK